MPKWRLPKRNIRNLFAKQTPTLLSWPTCRRILRSDETLFTLESSRKSESCSRRFSFHPVPTEVEVGIGRDSFSGFSGVRISIKSIDTIYLRNKPLNSYHGGYTFGKKMAIRDLFVKQTPKVNCYHGHVTWRIYGIQYVKVDIRTNEPLNDHFRF